MTRCSCSGRLANLPLRRSGAPHRPTPILGQHRAARTVQQRLVQIGLVANGVGAAKHGVFVLLFERGERLDVQQPAQAVDELVGVLRHREEPDAIRVVHILIEDAGDARGLERMRQRARVLAGAEHEQLHEQAIVRALGHAGLVAAFFGQVWRLWPTALLGLFWSVSHAGEYKPRTMDGPCPGRSRHDVLSAS